jgi:isoquinoline 1-oxidoreductase subunit beta
VNDLTRREIVRGSAAGITFAFMLGGLRGTSEFVARAHSQPALAPNVWISIATDGTVTIVSPAAEMGQGTFTALPVIVAEELDADWSTVRCVPPPSWDAKLYGNPGYGQRLSTTASFAINGYFKAMRIAGAQVRRVLLDAVATHWNVPAAELRTEPSLVVHDSTKRRITYGEIATFAKVPSQLPTLDDNDLKPRADFRLIGKDVPRVELPQKVVGAAQYAIDVQVAGMLYAALLQCPYDGGQPMSVDDAEARRIANVTDVVRIPGGVAVLGTTVEDTQAAKRALRITWADATSSKYDSESALEAFAIAARDMSRVGIPFVSIGDAVGAMKSADKTLHGEYRTRYVYHAQMEPLNATVAVSPDGQSAEIWAGSQSPTATIGEVAAALSIKPEHIKFNQQWLGGGYGRRSQQEVVIDAARLSKHAGKPVKLIWSREDDIRAGKFRPMTAHHIEAGFDAKGKLIAWHHRVVAESVANYMAVARGSAPPKTDQIVMKGTPLPQYSIPNSRAEHVVQPHQARLASFRGVGNGHNAFAIECFLDEICTSIGKDPIAYRLELSEGQPRVQAVLRTVAEMAEWPRPRTGRALGVAFMEKDATLAAGIAEVSVDRGSGLIRVHEFWVAIDAGIAVQPGNLAAQIEGSIVYGLGQVLRERITIKSGHVQQTNFIDYQITRMSDVPNITVRVLSTDNPPTGAGEDGLPLVACAVGNAVASLTGARLRELPFDPANMLALMKSAKQPTPGSQF